MSSGPADDVRQRIAAYAATVARLESARSEHLRRKPIVAKSFVALTTMGFASFAFGPFAGAWGSISATFFSVTAYAMYGVLVRGLTTEIDALRGEIKCMQAARGLQREPGLIGPRRVSATLSGQFAGVQGVRARGNGSRTNSRRRS